MFKKNLFLLFSVYSLYGNDVGIPDDTCALIIASRQTKYEVKEYIDNNISDTRYVTIYQSNNGWYAIALGFLKDYQSKYIIRKWKDSGKIPSDSFCTKGNKFKREVFISMSDEAYHSSKSVSLDKDKRYYSTKRNNSSCQNIDIDKEKIACYALIVGPKLCTMAIKEQNEELSSTIGGRVALSSACTAGVKSIFAKQYVPEDFLMSVVTEVADTGCKKVFDENEKGFLTNLFGVAGCVITGASWIGKMDAANRCVQDIERRCRE